MKTLIHRIDTRRATLLMIIGSVTCFAMLPICRAVFPTPDGAYPNQNTAEGENALFNLNVSPGQAQYNTAVGYHALFDAGIALSNTATGAGALEHSRGSYNTGIGAGALGANVNGFYNTAVGAGALSDGGAGKENTAVGVNALRQNSADNNVAIGDYALASNNTGFNNTASGSNALFTNTSGAYNTATGAQALTSNSTGGVNVATGYSALATNKNGFDNVAVGGFALKNNVSGSFNVATGAEALNSNTGGSNTATGHQALQKNTTGANNAALGFQAGGNLTSGSNNIVIGAGVLGVAGEANTTRIGKSTQTKTLIAGIYGKTVASGTKVGVMIDSTGKLGTVVSSARYKDNIKPMDKASEGILALKPITFRYNRELDPDGVPQFGLVAEDVEKVNPDLVVRGEDGKVSTVRYEAVNAMLLNEFLKEHHKVEQQQTKVAEQESTIAELKAALAKQQDVFASKIAEQQKQIEALNAGLQKISAAVELNNLAPTQVADNR